MNHIKMLKLYSWTELFTGMIMEKRAEEMDYKLRRYKNGSVQLGLMFFFPMLLESVTFTACVAFGNSFDLGQAFVIMTLLGMLMEPFRALPGFFNALNEFKVSMMRIQKFLECEEIVTSIKTTSSNES